MNIKVQGIPAKTIWFDNSLLRGWTGIAQDAHSIIKALTPYYNVKFLPNFFFLSRDNDILRRISSLIFILFKVPFRLPPSLRGIYYQPQLSPLFPGNGITHWFVRIHDIFPITNSSWFRRASSRQFRLAWFQAMERGAVFICSSHYMKTLILEQFPELESRVDVAYCTPRHFSSIQCGICAGCDFLASERSLGDYFISVGTIEPRKNYPFLLENWLVFREIDEADCSLLIIGKKGWKSNKLVKALVKFGSIESNNLIWIDTCCDGSLSQFYKGAKSFISTSFDEGFNLPALEARSVYSLPLLLSDISVHRELHSGYANFFRTASEFVNVITESNSIILNGDRGFESSSKSIVEIIAERTKIYL